MGIARALATKIEFGGAQQTTTTNTNTTTTNVEGESILLDQYLVL